MRFVVEVDSINGTALARRQEDSTNRTVTGFHSIPKFSRQMFSRLIKANQVFCDNTNRKGYPAIVQDFLAEKNEMSGVNPMTRYTIDFLSPPDTDFYDANEVEIPGVEPKFIVGSAPTLDPESRETFWRMVYDSDAKSIFYIENQPECTEEPFIPWRMNERKGYGKMLVSNTKVTSTKRDAQAILEVAPQGSSNVMKVTIDSEPRKSVLHLVRLLKDEKGPVLVICKNGLAKSCMFVMVHSVISLLNAKALRDPLDVLQKLRSDRWGAIQNKQQYLFIYQAVFDYISVKTE